MTDLEIPRRRLHHQRLTGAGSRPPPAVVPWLGAIQAQDYSGAKWSLALRGRGSLESKRVVIQTDLFRSLTRAERRAVGEASERLGELLGLPAVMEVRR